MGKKVCMIVFNHFKNDARVLKEAFSLIQNGYSVKVFALHEEDLPINENIKGLEVKRIPINPFHLRVLKSKKKKSSTPTKKKTSNSTLSAPQPKSKQQSKIYKWFYYRFLMVAHKYFTYTDFYKKYMEIIKSEPFDIFHAHDLNTLYPAYKASKYHKAKLVYDSHELYIERNKQLTPTLLYKLLSRQFEKYLITRTDKVITVGACIAEYLRDLYKISLPTVVMNAPSEKKEDISGKDLRAVLNINPNQKLAIYTGSITFNRGLEKLIESLTLLPNVYLVMMGYGKHDYIERLKTIACNNNVDQRLSFYGPVKPHEVTAYTSSCDLGVAPIQNACLSYFYCAPNKVFEYLIGGIPVIASNFPELEKIVIENKIGATFNPEDIQSIAEAVKNVFSNENIYQEMKENTKLAANKYNWENESKKLLNLYNSL